MLDSTNPNFGAAVRDGHGAPRTCAACGCRLNATDGSWRHFGVLGGRDARGCRVDCIELPHGPDGRALVARPA
jgi:hypothetical protein